MRNLVEMGRSDTKITSSFRLATPLNGPVGSFVMVRCSQNFVRLIRKEEQITSPVLL